MFLQICALTISPPRTNKIKKVTQGTITAKPRKKKIKVKMVLPRWRLIKRSPAWPFVSQALIGKHLAS